MKKFNTPKKSPVIDQLYDEHIKLGFKSQLIIKAHLKDQIDWLHLKYPELEWQGDIPFTIEWLKEKNDIENMKVYVHGLVLNDLGSSGFTSNQDHENNGPERDILMESISTEEDLEEYENGKHSGYDTLSGNIHTHHTMSASFSGQDWEDLRLNASLYKPFYLSLLVYNDIHKYYAIAGWIEEEEIQSKFLGKKKKKILYTFEFEISIELDVDDQLEEMFEDKLKKKKEKEDKKKQTNYIQKFSNPKYPSNYNYLGYEQQFPESHDNTKGLKSLIPEKTKKGIKNEIKDTTKEEIKKDSTFDIAMCTHCGSTNIISEDTDMIICNDCHRISNTFLTVYDFNEEDIEDMLDSTSLRLLEYYGSTDTLERETVENIIKEEYPNIPADILTRVVDKLLIHFKGITYGN